jgi:hypothetical protein
VWRTVVGVGAPHQSPCDAPMVCRDIQDVSLMAVVEVMSVGCMDRWTHGSKYFQPCPFDQTDKTDASHSSKVCLWHC